MITDNREACLQDVLKFRDYKADSIRSFLDKYPGCQMISLGLNIPGANKEYEAANKAFHAEISHVKAALHDLGVVIVNMKHIKSVAGNSMIFAVRGKSASEIKRDMVNIEEHHPLGRIFDIDVMNENGNSISRDSLSLPPRRCFLCEKDAKDCGRSRTHNITELSAYVNRLIMNYLN